MKVVPTKLIRKIAPEILSRTNELKRLSEWRVQLAERRKRLDNLLATVQQMIQDLGAEERDWVAEADRISRVPFQEIEQVISIALNDAQKAEG